MTARLPSRAPSCMGKKNSILPMSELKANEVAILGAAALLKMK